MYEVPAAKASKEQNRFTFSYKGVTYNVPKVKYLRPAFVRRLSGMSPADVVFALLDEFAPDLVEQLDEMEQIEDLYRAWASDSGIDLGESSGSLDSSQSTKEPSDVTSSVTRAFGSTPSEHAS